MKFFLRFLFPFLFLLNCISYYRYDKKIMNEQVQSDGKKLKVNRLYNTISLTKGSETRFCLDFLEDEIVDDSSSEFSVSIIINERLENRRNPFLALIHLSAALSTAGIIPFQQKIHCEYNNLAPSNFFWI